MKNKRACAFMSGVLLVVYAICTSYFGGTSFTNVFDAHEIKAWWPRAEHSGRVDHRDDAKHYGDYYERIACITEKSDAPCTFPLLTDYHKRCGYFAGSTSWQNVAKGFPKANLSAEICRIPSLQSSAQNLRDYIVQNKITSILTTGDSQGFRYTAALITLFKKASFRCKEIKREAFGDNMHLDYYTKGSGFTTNALIHRACKSCNSNLHICSDGHGRDVSVEYISIMIGAKTPINLKSSLCDNTSHPLCQNLTQQEYVFSHYLNRTGTYPQLIMIFSAFLHTVSEIYLREGYDEIRSAYGLITDYVPDSSTVIWYNTPTWHERKVKLEYPPEGVGLTMNVKIRLLNHFLADVQINHHKLQRKPRFFSFFDMYYMQEQLYEAWATDAVHSQPAWYQYVVSLTTCMLPTIPQQQGEHP